MKHVRFKYVILLLFTFLFACFITPSENKVKAEEGLDLTNAYRGIKNNYWILANYGEDVVGKSVVTFFLDPDAIDNARVHYIQLNEFDEYGDIRTVYYKRGIDSSFASRFTYTLVSGSYGEKNITVFLLEDLSNKPTAIIERFDVDRLHKVRTIENLHSADFVISREVENLTSTPYKVYLDIKENSCEYMLEEVTYTYEHTNNDGSKETITGRAILDTSNPNVCNRYYFTVTENATYDISVKDHFGYIKPDEDESLSIVINNFYDDYLNIVASYNHELTNGFVFVTISNYDGHGNLYPVSDISSVSYKFNGVMSENIKNIGGFTARENGIYTVYVTTTSGISGSIDVNITNIDRVAPTASVTSLITINSSDVESLPYAFDPLGYILATDNASNGDDLSISLKYYYPGYISIDNPTCAIKENQIEYNFYRYLYGVNDVCVEYEVTDEAGNSTVVTTWVTVNDNTVPTITYSRREIVFEIGDSTDLTDEELIERFGLNIQDNSILYTPSRTITINADLSSVNVEELNRYPVYISAVDESLNESETITLAVIVTEKILRINADPNQYSVYGEEIPEIAYTCNYNPCEEEILPVDLDKLSGKLYISSAARYSGEYEIYSTLSINSRRYTIVLENIGYFTIKPRVFKIVANSFEIDYKDPEPVYTWYLDTSVCNEDLSTKYTTFEDVNYSCTFVGGDSFGGGSYIYDEEADPLLYAGAIKREVCTLRDDNCVVKYNLDGSVSYYKIEIGDLRVNEISNGGRDNYYLDFYGLSEGILIPEYAKLYIYPKYVEVTFTDVSKIYGESDPNVNYADDDYSDPLNPVINVNAKRDDRRSNLQYEFTCFAYKLPISEMSTAECENEIELVIHREPGENIGDYKILPSYTNANYEVFFNEELPSGNVDSAYLHILKREIEMSVLGEDDNGKYTIFYEDSLPYVEIVVAIPLESYKGLANATILNINDHSTITFRDKLDRKEHPVKYLNQDGEVMSVVIGGFDEYITGIGKYIIDRDTATIVNEDEEDVLNNYSLTFNQGELEVLARQIYLKIVKGLTKVYGDNDPTYTDDDLLTSSQVVDGSGNFILQVINTLDNTTIVDSEDYEPFDKDKMVYYLARSNLRRGYTTVDVHDGEMVGEYLVSTVEENFINDTNYIISIYPGIDYYFEITTREAYLSINSNYIEFNYDNILPKFSYSYSNTVFGDSFVGQPRVNDFLGTYRNNGIYEVRMGDILALSSAPVITSKDNKYYINNHNTNILTSEIEGLDNSLITVIEGKYHVIDLNHNAIIDTNISLEETDVMWNYTFSVTLGFLNVIARRVVIVPDDDQTKIYGDDDPIITYKVRHVGDEGLEVILDETDFVGQLSRAVGEIPETDIHSGIYYITLGTLTPASKGAEFNFSIEGFESDHYFSILRRDLVIRYAGANADNEVNIFYGNSLEDLANGYTVVSGSQASNTNLCTSEVIEGLNVCDTVIDSVKGSIATDPEDTFDVGTYRIVNKDLKVKRAASGIDVSTYYNLTFVEATLNILPRVIYITPDENQKKIYGENDGEGACGITYTYTPSLILPTDTFSGCLQRESKIIDGHYTREEVGEYKIGLGTLTISPNYELVMAGSVMYQILERDIIITAKVTGSNVTKSEGLNVYTMTYGGSYTLSYDISGRGLARNSSLGISDYILNNVELSPRYNGVGSYAIVKGLLTVTNSRNYKLTYQGAQFNIIKRKVIVTPLEETLSKVYGDPDPINFNFVVMGDHEGYSGKLSRLEGENVGKYRITLGTLSFGDNYDVELVESYLEIYKRKVNVFADQKSKIYSYADPELTYTYSVENNFVLDIDFAGLLKRAPGEEVGVYEIFQNTLDLNANYEITYYSNTFTIYYIPIESIEIHNLTNNQYQTLGEETTVKVYATFNKGADQSDIENVSWSIVKDNSLLIEHYKDANNVVSFFPSVGTPGTYLVTASYNGISATYPVILRLNNIDSIYIRLNRGNVVQVLGLEEEVSYTADVHLINPSMDEVMVEWYAGENLVCEALLAVNNYCTFVPDLPIGVSQVYAKISSVSSNALDLTIRDNAAPRINLVNQGENYYIEAFQNATENSIVFIEPGFSAFDDVDGDVTSKVTIEGIEQIDYYKVGTYYIIYKVSDNHGHITNNYRVVVVQDTVSPRVTLNNPELSEMILEYGTEYIEYDAIAYDAYDAYYGITPRVNINTDLDVDKVGTYEVTYFAIDSNGLRGQAVRTVIIQDTIRPVITLIGEPTIYVEYKESYKDEGAWFEDNYDGKFKIYPMEIEFIREGEENRTLQSSVDTSILGRYYLTYYQEDSSGNAPLQAANRLVIVRDSTPPVITLKGSNPYILRYGDTYLDPGFTVMDNYDGDISDNVDLVSVTGFIGDTLGTYYFYYNARDTHNNIAIEVRREVIVLDLVSPIIYFTDACPQYMTIEALKEDYYRNYAHCELPGRDNGYIVVDDYLPDLEEIQNWVVRSGSVDSTTVGEYELYYNVSDRSGNMAVTLTRYINVVDTTPPVITLLTNEDGDVDFYVEVFNEYHEPGYIAYDEYDEYHSLETNVVIANSININKLNTYTVTYVAIDSNGNESAPVIREITVRDTVPPVVTLIGESELILERGTPYADYEYGASARDNYDGIIPSSRITIEGAPTGANLGDFEIKYCAKDSSENEGCAIRLVHVVDTIPPIIQGVEEGVYYRSPLYIYYYSPESRIPTDEILTGTLNGKLITNQWYVYQENTYTLVVRDDAGNTSEVNFVLDMTAPSIFGANDGEYINHDVDIYTDELLKSITYRFNNGGFVTVEEQTVHFEDEGQYWLYATDMAGNVSDVISFIIDKTPPIYSLQGVLDGGITAGDVTLITEPDVIVSVNNEYIPTNYTFTSNGYYQITIRDVAGNDVFLQFVINKDAAVNISNKNVKFISQNNAIGTFIAKGRSDYPRGAGFIYAMPQLDGTFTYISGTLFSDEEYAKLLNGEDIAYDVPDHGDQEMIVAFIVTLDELNKFTTQTVEGDDSSAIVYAIAAVGVGLLIAGFFYFFIVLKRKKDEEEEEEEEVDQEDIYY